MFSMEVSVCVVIFVFVSWFRMGRAAGGEDDVFPKEKCESVLGVDGCACYDYEVIAGIICDNVTDFGTLSKSLADGSIFEINTTYEISVAGFRSLPPRSMDGLIVFRLFLDDPDIETIEEGALDGVIRLRRFHVRQSSIKEIPDFRVIRHSLRNLNFENSQLTSLGGEHLQDLYLIETLFFVNNSIRSIEPDTFKGTDKVFVFDVSYNLLTSLPPNIFDTWKNLRKVVLSHNQIIHVNMLFAITHPKFIYLDYNNITNVDEVLHNNMTNVETLLIADNPIRELSNDSFNEKVPKIRFIYIDHCLISEFKVEHYASLKKLAVLDLSYNLIEKVPKQVIGFGYKTEIDLIGNKINEFLAEMTFDIKSLYLNENKLRALGTTLQFTQMVEVSVAQNQLEYLSDEDLRGVHGTANLELQENQIRWVDRNTFRTIRNDLHYLDLSHNFITALNGSVRSLSQLKALNVSLNRIESFEEDEFIGLNELSELYLQRNRIFELNGQLQQLAQLQYLVISHNEMRTLLVDQIPSSLQFLYFRENPMMCNCKLLPFLQWLNSSNAPTTDVIPCLSSTTNDEIHFPFWLPCPEPCQCNCLKDDERSFMSIDCSAQNLSIPPQILSSNPNPKQQFKQGKSNFTLNILPQLKVKLSTDPRFSIRDEVLGMNFENNSFQSMDGWRLPPNLRQLYLANNLLTTAPHQLNSLTKLKRVSLSNNPWECNCDTIGFRTWLLKHEENVIDVNNTRCLSVNSDESELKNRLIARLSDVDLCPTDIGFYVTLAFSLLSFLLLVAALKITYSRFEINIKVWLYSHGVTWVKEKDIDKDKIFDAFISFSHKDEEFVAINLIDEIEKRDPNIKFCVHFKDFLPGEFIHTNILNAVKNSKRTILVLSRNFLESEWCLMEFRAAHLQALEDKVNRIIVIKLSELPKEIDPAIKVYLESTTYLTWGEKYFWQNLMYVLPTSSKKHNVATV